MKGEKYLYGYTVAVRVAGGAAGIRCSGRDSAPSAVEEDRMGTTTNKQTNKQTNKLL